MREIKIRLNPTRLIFLDILIAAGWFIVGYCTAKAGVF